MFYFILLLFFNDSSVVRRIEIRNAPYKHLFIISINLLVVYRESVNLIGYITRRLSADSQQL